MNVAFLLVGDSHAQLARLMVDSVRDVMPNANIIQHTDLVTDKVAGVDSVVRLDWDGKFLMTYRLQHLANLREPTLVLDVDVVVQRDVSEIGQMPGDVVLVVRPFRYKYDPVFETMPFNTGVMFVRNSEFFADCLAWCQKAGKKIQRWGGDQLAVAAIAKTGKFSVGTMPGLTYNFSPRKFNDKRLQDAAIVHYKGAERKEWMLGTVPVEEEEKGTS